jgi:hypothetical protein
MRQRCDDGPVSHLCRLSVLVTVTAVLAGALAAVRRWHTGWGATPAERKQRMPGDQHPVSRFGMHATRALTIDAAPERVWPWIVQLGFGKAGWYSYDLLDNLGRPSARTILPHFQHVAVGDPAAPMNPFQPMERSPWRVDEVSAPHTLVWHNPDAGTWAWVLRALPDGRTRLLTRLRTSYTTPGTLAFAPILELADFPMYRRMLLGIKERAERSAGAQSSSSSR